jgi:FKBP-type peptidyl-prolyl cis-trans isomerase
MSVSDKLKALFESKSMKNLEDGQAYMAENAMRPEVTTTPSGLQYEVLVAAEGPKPKATQTVFCHYHGTTITGEVFDSSVVRKQPISLPLNRVIKGWTEGMQHMSVGSKFRFVIPAHLAYGTQQLSALIGANSTLIFEVELLGIEG